MKRFVWRWIAASSLLLSTLAIAETRPQYGGTLHIFVREAPLTLDPADSTQPDTFARRNLTLLIFETLVTLDERGRVHPALAMSWQSSSDNRHWQFRLRRGIRFHDGSTLTAESMASSLRSANPLWNLANDADSVTVDLAQPNPAMLTELALARNAIAKKTPDGKYNGTGPFHITDWQPGKSLSLGAEEDYWQGRPFLDAIQIEMGQSFHEQLTALELGRAELVEVAPEQARRLLVEGQRVLTSSPMELVALVFSRDAQSDEEKSLRTALALSVDRASIRNVLLQGAGQSTGCILPNWMSGYGFIFPAETDLTSARHAVEQVHNVPAWTIGYDTSDALSRVMAERIALNAKDAGLKLQLTSGPAADTRLTWIPLAASDPWLSLAEISRIAGAPAPRQPTGSTEELYSAEHELLTTRRWIPLFHLPATYAAAPRVRTFSLRPDGNWNLADVWLDAGIKP